MQRSAPLPPAIFFDFASVGTQPVRHCDGGPLQFIRLNPMTEAQMEYLLMIYSEENRWSQMTDSERQQGVAAYHAIGEKASDEIVAAHFRVRLLQ